MSPTWLQSDFDELIAGTGLRGRSMMLMKPPRSGGTRHGRWRSGRRWAKRLWQRSASAYTGLADVLRAVCRSRGLCEEIRVALRDVAVVRRHHMGQRRHRITLSKQIAHVVGTRDRIGGAAHCDVLIAAVPTRPVKRAKRS